MHKLQAGSKFNARFSVELGVVKILISFTSYNIYRDAHFIVLIFVNLV